MGDRSGTQPVASTVHSQESGQRKLSAVEVVTSTVSRPKERRETGLRPCPSQFSVQAREGACWGTVVLPCCVHTLPQADDQTGREREEGCGTLLWKREESLSLGPSLRACVVLATSSTLIN